ncbi:monocarboxylate transporter [Penicillium herquei]|nr:monocarboxylate transporter [Penicillium herquei]
MTAPLAVSNEQTQEYASSDIAERAGMESNLSTPGEPSNLRKLIIIIAAFMLNFSRCGLLFSFGIYQSLYEDMSQRENNPFTGASSVEISLIGSIAAALMKLGAPYVVAWCKYFSPQRVVCMGGIIYGVASVLSSFGRALWHFQLAQGLLIGIGTCLSFMPSMAVPPSWFGKYRGLNMGIISAGTGIGGLVWSPILTVCMQGIGFRDTGLHLYDRKPIFIFFRKNDKLEVIKD